MKIAIASDHAGYQLKDFLKEHMEKKGIVVNDLGGFAPNPVDYPLVGRQLAQEIAANKHQFGVLICGTGVGISIAANKVPGVRAVVCSEPYSAVMSRRHNNSNVLALGARVVGPQLAAMILDQWLDAPFEGGRHARRLGLIESEDNMYEGS